MIGIAARCVCGNPTVVATKPRLGDGTPFPTLYYLCHPGATAAISTLEANGVMAELTELLAADDDLRRRYHDAHDAYLADREGIEHVAEIAHVTAGRHARARQVPARPRGARPRRRARASTRSATSPSSARAGAPTCAAAATTWARPAARRATRRRRPTRPLRARRPVRAA